CMFRSYSTVLAVGVIEDQSRHLEVIYAILRILLVIGNMMLLKIANIVASRIECLRLRQRIENPEIGRGVGATAGDPLPARRIVGRIGVDQRVPEPALAPLP